MPAEPRRTRALLPLIMLPVLAAVLAAVWLLPRWLQPAPPAGLVQPAGCELAAGPCRASDGSRSVELELDPHRVRALEPLQFRVRTQGIEARSLTIQLEGRDMYMGINQVQLQPDAREPGLWTGTGELAICTTGEMVWRARILSGSGDAPVDALFEFSAR